MPKLKDVAVVSNGFVCTSQRYEPRQVLIVMGIADKQGPQSITVLVVFSHSTAGLKLMVKFTHACWLSRS